MVSTIYSLTPPLPELVPVRHGHPRPPEGPRPRRGAAASQIRRQSTGTRSGDLRSSEAYALPIQGYHMDLSTGACGGAGGPSAQPLFNSGSTPRIKKLRNSLATSRGLLPLRASLRQPGRPRVLLTSFSRGGGPAQPTLCSAQKKFWRSGRHQPRQLSTDVDRFDGFDGSLDGPMGDGRPPQTPPPGLEPASTRSNQALRTALQAGLQN